MTSTLVRQLDISGCGPACVAMVAGLTYEEACALFPKANFKRKSGGLTRRNFEDVLQRLGFGLCRRKALAPFANVCIAELKQLDENPRHWHWVVILGDGTVLDPDEPKPTHISNVVHRIISMTAVHRFAEPV